MVPHKEESAIPALIVQQNIKIFINLKYLLIWNISNDLFYIFLKTFLSIQKRTWNIINICQLNIYETFGTTSMETSEDILKRN